MGRDGLEAQGRTRHGPTYPGMLTSRELPVHVRGVGVAEWIVPVDGSVVNGDS